MSEYPVAPYYPRYRMAGRRRGVLVGSVECWLCHQDVRLDDKKRLMMHKRDNKTLCDGSRRFYWHLFGTRLKTERLTRMEAMNHAKRKTRKPRRR